MSAFTQIVGQDQAVALLQEAIDRPAHAYLFTGARGSGIEDAVKAWAAERVAPGDARVADLARRGSHPDVVEFDSTTSEVSVAEARAIISEMYASPIETEHKVVIILAADRLSAAAANALLKTLEEPPPRSSIILVAERPDRLLATVRSRCQRIDFAYLSNAAVRAGLAVDPETKLNPDEIDLAVRLAGGRLDRARALVGILWPVRSAFIAAAVSLDGSGAQAARAANQLEAVVKQALVNLDDNQKFEIEELDRDGKAVGYPDQVIAARRKTLGERHKRERRRVSTDIWLEGLTAIETWYRDALVGPTAPALASDYGRAPLSARAAARALDACRQARQAITHNNASEVLNLLRLLVRLGFISSQGKS